MKIVMITDESGIDVFTSWNQVKKFSSFDKSDFTKIGKDYVLTTTQESYEVAKDIKLLEHVAAKKMFTKNKMDLPDIIGLVTLGLVFIGLVM